MCSGSEVRERYVQTFAFAYKDKLWSPFGKRAHAPNAPYDAYEEDDDTEENAKSGFLKKG